MPTVGLYLVRRCRLFSCIRCLLPCLLRCFSATVTQPAALAMLRMLSICLMDQRAHHRRFKELPCWNLRRASLRNSRTLRSLLARIKKGGLIATILSPAVLANIASMLLVGRRAHKASSTFSATVTPTCKILRPLISLHIARYTSFSETVYVVQTHAMQYIHAWLQLLNASVASSVA